MENLFNEIVETIEKHYHIKMRRPSRCPDRFNINGQTPIYSAWSEIGPYVIDLVFTLDSNNKEHSFVMLGSYGSPFVQIDGTQNIIGYIDREVNY